MGAVLAARIKDAHECSADKLSHPTGAANLQLMKCQPLIVSAGSRGTRPVVTALAPVLTQTALTAVAAVAARGLAGSRARVTAVAALAAAAFDGAMRSVAAVSAGGCALTVDRPAAAVSADAADAVPCAVAAV